MGKMKRMLALFAAFSLAAGSIFGAEVKTAKAETETEIPVTESGEMDDEDSFKYTFKIQSEWEKHYNAEMTLKNTTDNKMENWEVAFEYDGEIENIRNAKIVSHDDNVYVIKNVGWNQDIAVGEQVTFGFTVQYEEEKPEEPRNLDMQKVSEQVLDGCDIIFKQFTKYENKIEGQIEITNTSDSYIEDWCLDFEGNFEIVDIWNAKVIQKKYDSEDGDNPTKVYYSMDNMGYNQSIEPGQTINFGFVGELLDGENGKVEKESLYQFTVYPYDEEDELDEDDCIWEGDEEDDPMPVVDDEIFDEDDYDRMNEDELAAEEGLFRIIWYIYLRLVYQFCLQ